MHSNVIIKQKVNAPVDKVWDAITVKDQLKEWYHNIPDFSAQVHTSFSFHSDFGSEKQHHHGEILEVIPEQKLKYSWSYPDISKERTILKWELEKEGDHTLVTLTHKGLENLEHLGNDFSYEKFEKKWTQVVTHQLKSFVEQ